MKRKFPESVYNPITFAGVAVALISFGLILFLILLEAVSTQQKPYMGIIAFVILPGFLIFGLILVAFGIIRHRRRLRSGKDVEFKFPVFNFNDPKQRTAFTVFFVGTILLLLFSAFGSYKAYEYTDSDQFCGTLCHKVMTPEYTAYQVSPHARVGCVQCHIGSGAGWYVRSKLSGAYQVYSVLFNKYSKPIPTPIENLRPARETCEQCHWPEFFYSQKEIKNSYFLSDKQNSKSTNVMLLKIGGGNEETGITSGIHWHMNIANKITYIASDSSRQTIPWVKSESRDGKVTVYKSTDFPFKNDTVANGSVRVMDCIDCHNRPTHIYHPPYSSVDHMMASGLIDTSLPYIKSIAVDALEKSYSSKDIAFDSIKISMEEFYNTRYPKIASTDSKSIEKSINSVKEIYRRNYFPEMGVSWKKFPNNIGHMYYPGCFRCHDGKHVSASGKVLTRDCNSCHVIASQESENYKAEVSLKGLEFEHPVDIGDSWKTTLCTDCHGAE